ncbi:MAG: TIGR00725 family protein [Acidobacteria bacterium]|nr:TIGR00725 family protein [Acidobacteriota bacterium]
MKKRVGIIGSNIPDALSLKHAEEMGQLVAQNGYILVNGGMGGVMEASARGCKAAGGFVIAITPGKSRDEGNPFSDIVIPTGLGHMRNGMVVLNSDIVVAIDGSYGTLSEIAYCKIYDRIVLGLNTWAIEGVIHLLSPTAVMAKINEFFKL